MPVRRVSIRLANLGYEDRCRMARELRESTVQELAALKINLGVIEKSGSHLGPKAQSGAPIRGRVHVEGVAQLNDSAVILSRQVQAPSKARVDADRNWV